MLAVNDEGCQNLDLATLPEYHHQLNPSWKPSAPLTWADYDGFCLGKCRWSNVFHTRNRQVFVHYTNGIQFGTRIFKGEYERCSNTAGSQLPSVAGSYRTDIQS